MKKYPILLFLSISISLFAQKRPVEYVNPFIGTGGHGHTFPGATVPFGMVQLSPDTRTEGWDAASGYHYSDSTILGFSHTHLNGTGVNDLCDILITPSVSRSSNPQKFQHKNEIAKAGYYKTVLDNDNIQVELTASERVGFHRYTFPSHVKEANITLSLNERNQILNPYVEYLGSTLVKGRVTLNAWAKKRFLTFTLETNLNPTELRMKVRVQANKRIDTLYQLLFDVSKTHELLVKVALSPVSEENALENMQKEIPHWDFDKTRREAEAQWEKYLNRIQIDGGSEDQRTIFYTALYHTLIHPSVWQDVNGDYRGLDNKVHNSRTMAYHAIFSLWDTYRALHPLYTILCPEKVPDFINGFIDDFEKSGHLPVWNFSGNETWCMIGNHSIPVIADAYIKGIRGFDAEKALNAMIKTVNRDTFGLKAYREKGYIPSDTEGEAVSKTLEYAYDDYCIAQMAKAMGKDDIYKEYIQRSQNWKNIFNPKTGFFQAKINETYVEPFDPREVNFNFTEGNAWQYAFAVQHDIQGLIQMLGGEKAFEDKLDAFFQAPSQTTGRDQVDITGLIGQYAHGNEPSHHIAYLYNYVGKPHKTQRLIRQIQDNFYKNAPDGLIGNEDCGQMSAWYVMSSMGFYPVNPCGDSYQVGSIGFKKFIIMNKNREPFILEAVGFSSENAFTSDIGYGASCFFRDHSDILKGGTHTIDMTKAPDIDHKFTCPDDEDPNIPKPAKQIGGYIGIPFISKGKKLFTDKQSIELSCADTSAEIYYTTDGSNPVISGTKYTQPILIDQNKTLKFEARHNGEHSKIATATFKKIDKTKSIVLKNAPSPQFTGGATDALIDGEYGSDNWQLGGWQGFEGIDVEAVIDLKKETEFKRIVLRCMEDHNAWIFTPTAVQVFTSQDGVHFELLSEQEPDFAPNTEGSRVRPIGIKKKGTARYIKVVAKPLNPIPAWHKGAGGKGWIFMDEIRIE
jgi:predicted alpha-1,2-mannosidase